MYHHDKLEETDFKWTV